MKTATTEAEQAAMEKIQDAKAKRIRKAWRAVMGTEEGRIVVCDIMAATRYGCTPFDKHNSEMCKNVGKQELGLWMQRQLTDICPSEYMKLLVTNFNELV